MADIPCMTCGKRRVRCIRCGKVQAAMTAPPLSGPSVVVPRFQVRPLVPRNRKALATVVVGPEAEACFAVARPWMAAYADRVKADFVVLRQPGLPEWPMSCKFQAPEVLAWYDRVAYVDADTLPHPGCVDLFALADGSDFAACDDRLHHALSRGGQLRMARYAAGGATPFYFNMGVWVATAKAMPWLLPPEHPLVIDHCAEEEYLNRSVWRGHVDGWISVRSIDRRANWQSWQDWNFRMAPRDAILHWSGGGLGRERRAELMAAAAEVVCGA